MAFVFGAPISSGGGSSFTPGGPVKFPAKKEKKINLGDIEQLKTFAQQKGLEVKEKKPSLFSRAIDIISRPLFASAGAAKAIVRGDENPLIEAWKGLTGQEKETYSDVLEEAGVENKWIKGGVGFALDVALDPTTYLGGAFVKGVGKGLGVAGRVGLSGIQKFNPELARGLTITGKSLKDAMGKAFVFGHGTTVGLADDVGRTINRLGIAKENIAARNIKLFEKADKKKIAEAGDLMIKNRRLELKARQGKKIKFIKSKDKEVNSLVDLMRGKAKELSRKAGLDPEKSYQNYIPFLRTDKLARVDESAKALRAGSEGFKKEFKDLIPDKKLLKKPIEAYTRREYEIARNGIVKGSLKKMIQGYGKKLDAFKNADEALEQGYRLIKDKGMFGKPMGYLKEVDLKFIDNYLYPEFKTIDMLAKATGYDTLTNWFKTAVTAYFPAFHVRNYISGNIQNYSVLGRAAFNPRNHSTALGILKGSNKNVALGGKTYNLKELNKILKENFQGASRFISDLGDHIDEVMGGFRLKKISKARQVGSFVEMNQKAVAMTTALSQGKTLKQAIKIAERAGFDYSKITPFEQKVLKRIIPFYTFARKNAELQLRTLAKRPERIVNQVKFANMLGSIFGGKMTKEDVKGLPPWALAGLGFKVQGNRYLTKFGIPMEEFFERLNKPLMSSLGSLNPIIKFPLESKMGYDFFREQQLTDITKISPELVKILPESIKEKMSVKRRVFQGKESFTADPRYLHFLRNIPTARLQNTLEKLTNGDMAKVDKMLAFLTGAKIYDIDIELQKYFTERDTRRRLEDELLRRGEAKKFERLFIPKNQ